MKRNLHKTLTIFIAAVWLINGLFVKVLNYVPRHEQIVSRILGDEHSTLIVRSIGVAEVLMALWVLSRIKSGLNAKVQISLVVVMNILEFFIARDLLLWGGFNAFFALIFVGIVYYNEFVLKPSIREVS